MSGSNQSELLSLNWNSSCPLESNWDQDNIFDRG